MPAVHAVRWAMPRYIRAVVPGGTFFFTVVLLERQQCLLTEKIDELRAAFAAMRLKKPVAMDAIVVLPDHLHCIWTLPPNDTDFSSRWHCVKACFARALPIGEQLSHRRQIKGERGIWQRRFWEHVVRDERDFERHADYIHFNPVKHRLVTSVAEWPYSSFHRYVERGVYPVDWAANEEVKGLDLE